MSIDDLLKNLPIDDLAAKLGVSPAEAARAAEEGGAAVLAGLQKNAASPEGAAALEAALQKHANAKPVASIDEIDQEDGDKIVRHVFGDQTPEVAQQLFSSEKTSNGIDFGKLLPMIAPVVMGLIANKSAGNKAGGAQGGIGDIIGGLLGGGGAQGGIGDMIGGVLGGLFGKK